MERIRIDWKKGYDKVRAGKLVLAVFSLCAALYLSLLYLANQRVVLYDVTDCEIAEEGRIEYEISRILRPYNYIKITGYAYEPGVSIDRTDTTLLAFDPAADVYYKLPTESVKKEKLTEKADDGFNYDYAQFTSVVLRNKIPSGCRVCILYRGNGASLLVQTDEVIYD